MLAKRFAVDDNSTAAAAAASEGTGKRKENGAGIFQRKDPSIFFSFPSLTFQPDRGEKTFPGRVLYFVQDSFASDNRRGGGIPN